MIRKILCFFLFNCILCCYVLAGDRYRINSYTGRLDLYQPNNYIYALRVSTEIILSGNGGIRWANGTLSASGLENPATTTLNMGGFDMINLSTMSGKANTDFVWRSGANNSLYMQPSFNNSVMIRNSDAIDKLGFIEFFNKNYSYVDFDFNNKKLSNIASVTPKNITVTYGVIASTFAGNGEQLTNLTPANISAGALNSVTSLTASSVTVTGQIDIIPNNTAIYTHLLGGQKNLTLMMDENNQVVINNSYSAIKLSIPEGKGVGIRKNFPAYDLDVNGTGNFDRGILTSTMTATGLITASSITVSGGLYPASGASLPTTGYNAGSLFFLTTTYRIYYSTETVAGAWSWRGPL